MESVENAVGASAVVPYGVVLKGSNQFAPTSGVTGAATAKVDIPVDAADGAPDSTCLSIKPPKGAG